MSKNYREFYPKHSFFHHDLLEILKIAYAMNLPKKLAKPD